MAKALHRIKTGTEGGEQKETRRGKYIEAGGDVPAEIADAAPWAVSQQAQKRKLDSSKPETMAGVEAATESILHRPDNPNRPAGVPGVSDWQVSRDAFHGTPMTGPMQTGQAPQPKKQTPENRRLEQATDHGFAAGGGETADRPQGAALSGAESGAGVAPPPSPGTAQPTAPKANQAGTQVGKPGLAPGTAAPNKGQSQPAPDGADKSRAGE